MINPVRKAPVITGVVAATVASIQAQPGSFMVTVVPPVHGTLQLDPALPPGAKYPARKATFAKNGVFGDKHRIKTMFVLFDSVWDHPQLGRQRAPKAGVYNPGWLQRSTGSPLRH